MYGGYSQHFVQLEPCFQNCSSGPSVDYFQTFFINHNNNSILQKMFENVIKTDLRLIYEG